MGSACFNQRCCIDKMRAEKQPLNLKPGTALKIALGTSPLLLLCFQTNGPAGNTWNWLYFIPLIITGSSFPHVGNEDGFPCSAHLQRSWAGERDKERAESKEGEGWKDKTGNEELGWDVRYSKAFKTFPGQLRAFPAFLLPFSQPVSAQIHLSLTCWFCLQ